LSCFMRSLSLISLRRIYGTFVKLSRTFF
jgi:hypothetical protein